MAGDMREAADTGTHEKQETDKTDSNKINNNEQNKQTNDVDMGSRPGQELEDLLKEQGKNEREMMKKLINENVNLERQNKLVSEKIKELQAKKEVMAIDLECEKQNRMEIEEQVKDMQKEMKVLLIDAKRAQVKRKQKNAEADDDTMENLQTRDQFIQCILHLQFRLKRLTEQEEAKDEMIAKLQKQLSEKEKLTSELEKHISDQSTLDDIHQKLQLQEAKTETVKRSKQTNLMRSTPGSSHDPALPAYNPNASPPQSKVCVIQ